MRLDRRTLLRRASALTLFGALPFVFARRARAARFGALVPDPDGILDLPDGFSYAVLESTGDAMSDGYVVPARPDGMAVFPAGNGSLVLLRNHELNGSNGSGPYAGAPVPPEAYDGGTSPGGVTRLVVDAQSFARISSNLSLVGTVMNCAGGPSPWGWISCEETFSAQHGYSFVCSPDATTVQAPQRIVGYGHFNHEAVAIDPRGNVAYLTEDRSDSCLYRFVPDDPAVPFTGRLQALGIAGQPGFSTASGLTVGTMLDLTWIDLANPDPTSDTLRQTAVNAGAAIIRRGEGITRDGTRFYISATSGGDVNLGQIFALDPTDDGGTLTLVAESTGASMLNGPDNLTMAPWGDLIVAEDSLSGSTRYLRGLTTAGEFYDIARTTLGELSGVCLSPDGRALFVNIQNTGQTIVITGPFPVNMGTGSGGQGGQSGSAGSGQGGANAGTSGTTNGTSGNGAGGSGTSGGGAGGNGAGGNGASAGGRGGSGTGGDSAGEAGMVGEGGAPDTTGGSAGAGGVPGSSGAGQAGSAMGTGGSGTPGGGAGTAGKAGSGGAGVAGNPPKPAAPVEQDPGCGCRVVGR